MISRADGLAHKNVAGVAKADEEDEDKSFNGSLHCQCRVVISTHTTQNHVDDEDRNAPEELIEQHRQCTAPEWLEKAFEREDLLQRCDHDGLLHVGDDHHQDRIDQRRDRRG